VSIDRAILEKVVWTGNKLVPRFNAFRILGIPGGVTRVEQQQHRKGPLYTSNANLLPKTMESEVHPLFHHYINCQRSEPHSFVLELPNGFSIHDGASLTQEGLLVEEVAHEFRWGPIKGHRLFGIRSLRPFSRIAHFDMTVASLSTRSSDNFYHWVWDILPRFFLLDSLGYRPEKIYIDVRKAFQRDALKLLGYSMDQIIPIDQYPCISATQLLVPAFPAFRTPISAWAGNYLRETFWEKVPKNNSAALPRRVYISRGDASWRKVLNEPEVIALCQRYGFEAIQTSKLTFAEQVNLFRQVEAIVSPHGAGLANVAFCAPGTKVIELFAEQFIREAYWVQCSVMGLDYTYLRGKPCNSANLNKFKEDILVDLKKLENQLQLVI
jgi:hypothetical protein